MIRKKAISLVLTVLVALAILTSLQAVNVTRHDVSVAGNPPSTLLADGIATPTPGYSNPSGGGNSGG